MVGCMLESSALIAAGAVIAQRTDYADLDGAWLIGNDPFRGWHFDRGVLSPPADGRARRRAGLSILIAVRIGSRATRLFLLPMRRRVFFCGSIWNFC